MLLKKYKFLVLIVLFSIGFSANAQVLVLGADLSPLDIKKLSLLKTEAQKQGVRIEISNSSNALNFDNLKSYKALFFYKFKINSLSLEESSAILSYFKTGGGAIGVHDIFEENPKWLWFEHLFGRKIKTAPLSDINVITNLSLKGVSLPPLWKLTDSPIIVNNQQAGYAKVLMDISAKPLAWYHKTSFGNTCFYTSLGGADAAWENPHFLNLLIGAIKYVMPVSLDTLENKEEVLLPSISQFKSETVLDSLSDAFLLKSVSDDQILIFDKNGSLFTYNPVNATKYILGKFPSLVSSEAFTIDPEYATNGYVYFYKKTEDELPNVSRIHINQDVAVADSFSVFSSLPNLKDKVYTFGGLDMFGLPKYYDKKHFVLKENKIYIEQKDDTDEVISREPFVVPILDYIQSFDFNKNGELLLLSSGKLTKVSFEKDGHFAPIARFEYQVSTGKLPKVASFEAKGISENTYSWEIDNKILNGQKVKYIFRKVGTYKVKLKVENAFHKTAEFTQQIDIKK